MLLVMAAGPQPARRRRVAEAAEVAVELGREEAGPPHLAVGDDVDAGLLLVAQGGVDRVVERLPQVCRAELAPGSGRHRGHQP